MRRGQTVRRKGKNENRVIKKLMKRKGVKGSKEVGARGVRERMGWKASCNIQVRLLEVSERG